MPLGVVVEPLDARVQFQPDSGTPRTALRTTAVQNRWTIPPLHMGETQFEVLQTFCETTLAHLQKYFDWTNPRKSDGLKTFRFVGPPIARWATKPRTLPAAQNDTQVYRAGGSASQRIVEVTLQLLEFPWNPSS